jgi:hypothetical protein
MMPEKKKNILKPEQLSFLALVLSETEYEKIEYCANCAL